MSLYFSVIVPAPALRATKLEIVSCCSLCTSIKLYKSVSDNAGKGMSSKVNVYGAVMMPRIETFPFESPTDLPFPGLTVKLGVNVCLVPSLVTLPITTRKVIVAGKGCAILLLPDSFSLLLESDIVSFNPSICRPISTKSISLS